MSEEIIPDAPVVSDVPETVVDAESATEENALQTVNWSEKSLAELVRMFEELVQNEDRMKMPKEAEAIKSAFYRRHHGFGVGPQNSYVSFPGSVNPVTSAPHPVGGIF